MITVPKKRRTPEGWARVYEPEKEAPVPAGVVRYKEDITRDDYIPKTLKGTKFEGELDNITKNLFPQKEQGFDMGVRLDAGNIEWSLRTFWDVKPDVASKAQFWADQRGQDFSPVIRNYKDVEEWEEAAEIIRKLRGKDEDSKGWQYPYTAAWLHDPVKMAQSKDDVEVLTEIEGIITKFYGPKQGVRNMILKNSIKSAVKTPLIWAEALAELVSVEARRIDTIEQIDPYTADLKRQASPYGILSLVAADLGEEKRAKVIDFIGRLKDSDILREVPLPRTSGLEQYMYDFAAFVPQLAAIMGASIATGGPMGGMAVLGSHIFATTYEGNREAGALPERSFVAGAFNATTQAILEGMSLDVLFKAFKTTGTKKIIVEFAKAMLTEVGTEWLQEYPEEIAMIWGAAEKEGHTIQDQIKIFVERLPETTKRGIYAGAIVAPVALIGASVKLPYDYARNKVLQNDVSFWDGFMEASAKSKLRTRAPETFEDHVETVIDGNDGPKNIYLSLDVLRQVVEDNDGNLEDIAEKLEITDQLAEAEETGIDLEINSAKFAKSFAGTEFSVALKNDIRFDPEGSTVNEYNQNMKDMLDKLKDLQAQYRENSADIRLPDEVLSMREVLMKPKAEGGFGLKVEDADAKLSVFLAGGKVLSKKQGETTEEWFRRVNPLLKVGGEYVAPVKEVLPEGAGTLAITKEHQPIIDSMKKEIKAARAGKRVPIIDPETGKAKIPEEFIADVSTFPKYFRDKGVDKKEALAIINKVLTGKELTERQKNAFEGMYVDKNETEGWEAPDLSIEGVPTTLTQEAEILTEGVTYNQEGEVTENEKFKKWFANSKVVDEDGDPLTVYHGTTHVFDTFTEERGNLENDMGKAFYFTSGQEDVSKNYAGEGPDLTNRLEREAERIEADKDIEHDEALGIARAELTAHGGAVIPAYLSLQNPLILEKGGGTIFELEKDTEYYDDLAKDEIDRDDYEDDDEYQDALREKSDEIYFDDYDPSETGLGGKLRDAILNIAPNYTVEGFGEVDGQGIIADLEIYPGMYMTAFDLYEAIKSNEKTNLIADDEGNLANGQFMREVFEEIGFDGVVYEDPTQHFKTMDIGFDEEGRPVKHFVAFEPTQIKSTFNKGEFSPQDPRILFQVPDKIVRGAVTFGDTETLINLFNSANMSTFLHETAHVFTRDMDNIIKAGKGDKQLKKDYKTLLDFADGKLDEPGYEKIARAFETYLSEGKAPSVALVEAFQRFKAWLTAVYKSLRGLDVKINDDIRQVFDRLLAAEKDIEEVQDYYEARKALIDLLPTTAKQKNVLIDMQVKAKKSAIDIQTTKYMKAYLDAVGGKAAIIEEAAKIIDNDPVYKAIADITSTGGYLSYSSIKEGYGKNLAEELKAKNFTRVKGKTSLAEMSAKYDFGSEQELMNNLLEADSRAEAIKDKASEILATREQEIRTELDKQENVPGEEAYHNDAQLAFLIAETNILATKIAKITGEARTIRLEARLYKDAADKYINGKKVSQATRYDRFAKSEEKHRKEAERAMQANDLPRAHEAKKLQVLNHALVQAAVKARDEKFKIENRYRNKKFKASLKTTENDFAEVALDLAYTYKLSDLSPQNPESVPKIANLDELLEGITPEWILTKDRPEDFKTWRDLTMQQLRELDAVIRSVIHYGRQKLLSIEDEKYKTVQSVVDASLEDIDKLKDKAIFNEFNIKGKALNKLDGLLARITMTEFVFERLDNYSFTKDKEFGPLRTIFNRGVKAETDYAELKAFTFSGAADSWDTLYQARQRLEQKYGGKDFDLPGVPMIPAMKKLGRDRWTTDRLISFILNMGNESSLAALMNSYEYNDAQMATITKQFTAKELEAIQGIWDATNMLFPALDAVYFRVYNRHLEKVDARELIIDSADGVPVKLKGGYYPLIFDHLISDKVAAQKEEDLMKNRQSGVFRSTKPKDGHTYARKEGHSLPPELSTSVWFTHISDVARNVSHTEYMRDLNRITSDPAWRDAVRDKAGRPVYKQIREWVKFQARAERRLVDPWDKLLERQRQMATIAILGANLSVGIKQRLSMINAASEIGWDWIIQGYRDMDMTNSVLGLSNSEAWQKILDLSPYMKVRVKSFDRELADVRGKMDPFVKRFNILGKDFTWRDVQDFMFEFIQMNDRATVGVVWQGAFNKYMADNATKDMTDNQKISDAVIKADAIVRATQPSALPFDLNSLQRSEGIMRIFTSFMTWSFKYGNRFVSKTQAYKDGAISTQEYSRFVMLEAILPAWGAMLISSFLINGDLPEWWEWFTSPVEQSLSWIPIIRDIPRAIKYRSPVGASPAFEGVNRITKAGKTTWEWATDDEEFSKVLWDIGRATEVQLGVPALKVVKDIKRTYDNITEEE